MFPPLSLIPIIINLPQRQICQFFRVNATIVTANDTEFSQSELLPQFRFVSETTPVFCHRKRAQIYCNWLQTRNVDHGNNFTLIQICYSESPTVLSQLYLAEHSLLVLI